MDNSFPELRNCEVCKHDKIDKVEQEFLSEMITGKEAAEILGVGQSKFKLHIEHHLKKDIAMALSANAGPLAKRIFDKGNELIGSCDRILETIHDVTEQWKDKKRPEWVTALVKLEIVLGNNIEKLTKMHGELRESSVIRVEQLNIQVNNMTQELVEGMCPACKQRLAPKILELVNRDARA